MEISNSYNRLFSLWGHIDNQHNELISKYIKGSSVLDVGCGYGSLVNYLTLMGLSARGIDYDIESITVGKKLYPKSDITLSNAEQLDGYPSDFFDTVVMKDSFHHLVREGDTKACFDNFKRILKKDGRIVVFDPNPNWIVKLARKLISHKDPEANLDVAKDVLSQYGFFVKGVVFYEFCGIPLSGGYVGIRLIPNVNFLNLICVRLNKLLSKSINGLSMGRYLCWRYLIYADREK